MMIQNFILHQVTQGLVQLNEGNLFKSSSNNSWTNVFGIPALRVIMIILWKWQELWLIEFTYIMDYTCCLRKLHRILLYLKKHPIFNRFDLKSKNLWQSRVTYIKLIIENKPQAIIPIYSLTWCKSLII